MGLTKQLGKLHCWRELKLSTKALHYCVPVKSNFALILCEGKIGKGENKMDIKHSYMLVSLCLFQHMFSPYARFPPERKIVAIVSCPCGHTSLCILISFFWKPDCFKAERNKYVPFATKILEGTSAAPLKSNRALALKASWCSFGRIPVAWLFQLRLGNGFALKVDCGTQVSVKCKESSVASAFSSVCLCLMYRVFVLSSRKCFTSAL